MNELRLLCLKNAGSTCSINADTFLITNDFPSFDHDTIDSNYGDCINLALLEGYCLACLRRQAFPYSCSFAFFSRITQSFVLL